VSFICKIWYCFNNPNTWIYWYNLTNKCVYFRPTSFEKSIVKTKLLTNPTVPDYELLIQGTLKITYISLPVFVTMTSTIWYGTEKIWLVSCMQEFKFMSWRYSFSIFKHHFNDLWLSFFDFPWFYICNWYWECVKRNCMAVHIIYILTWRHLRCKRCDKC
jgi:hypothetical protein